MRVWKTKDGRSIPIAEMTDDHLANAIRFLVRAHSRYVQDVACSTPMFQGEMAQYYAEQEQSRAIESRPEELYPILQDLRREFALRAEKKT